MSSPPPQPGPRAAQQVGRLYRIVLRPLLAALGSLALVYLAMLGGAYVVRYRSDLPRLESLFAILQSAATIAALVVGGAWGYYRFARGRTLVRRLEPRLQATELSLPGENVLVVDAGVRNIGNVTVPLTSAYLLLSPVTTGRPRGPVAADLHETERIDVLTYLGRDRARYTLEPGEEMHRHVTVPSTLSQCPATRIDLLVESGRERCWSATAIVASVRRTV